MYLSTASILVWLLRNVSAVLQDEAILVITLPNPKWSRSRLQFFRTGYLACFTEDDLALNHHVFTPWPHIVERLLDYAEFDVIEYVTLDGVTQPFDRYISITYPFRVSLAIVGKLIELGDPSACGLSYGLVARHRARLSVNDKNSDASGN